MTMLEIFKERMPEGLTIIKSSKRDDWYKMLVEYKGTEANISLRATCQPKNENKECDYAIATVMMSIALKRNDLELCKQWKDFQDNLNRHPSEADNQNPKAEIDQALDAIIELASQKDNIFDNIDRISNLVAFIEAKLNTPVNPSKPRRVNFKK